MEQLQPNHAENTSETLFKKGGIGILFLFGAVMYGAIFLLIFA